MSAAPEMVGRRPGPVDDGQKVVTPINRRHANVLGRAKLSTDLGSKFVILFRAGHEETCDTCVDDECKGHIRIEWLWRDKRFDSHRHRHRLTAHPNQDLSVLV